jgi:hypothetical protein
LRKGSSVAPSLRLAKPRVTSRIFRA